VIDVEAQYLREEVVSFLGVAQSAITQSHYIATVNAIALVEVVVPDSQVGE
jgi:hypothetical protein